MAILPPDRYLPVTSDPDFRSGIEAAWIRSAPNPAAYRRLVVNPFLAFLPPLVLFYATRFWLSTHPESGTVLVLLGFWVVAILLFPRLLQYVCLDCGGNGFLRRWRAHVCPRVAARVIQNRPRRSSGIPHLVQVIAWLYLVGVLAYLIHQTMH